MTYLDDPLTWRIVSAMHHIQAVMCSTRDVATGPDYRLGLGNSTFLPASLAAYLDRV